MRNKLINFAGIFLAIAAALGFHPQAHAAGSILYAATTGNDINPGTFSAPFKTIQKCVTSTSQGSTCIVMEGEYPEAVSIKQNGISLRASGKVMVRQFYITGSNNTLAGFTVSDDASNYGIRVSGNFNLIKNNEVYHTRQDGIWFFGHDNVFRNNYIHDILSPEIGGDPHVDCFQTWDWNWDTYQVLFEGNVCDHSRTEGSNQMVLINSSRVHDVIFRNNRFIMHDAGYSPLVITGGWNYVIDSNYFCNTTGQGIAAIYLESTSEVNIINNNHAGYGDLKNGRGSATITGNITGKLPCQVNPPIQMGDEMPAGYPVSAPAVVDVRRNMPSPSGAGVVTYTVSFSEAVSGVDVDDFHLNTSGAIAGATIADVKDSGTGDLYTVDVNSGSGNGTLWIDVIDNDSILSTGGTPLGGAGRDNGGFFNAEAYQIQRIEQITGIELNETGQSLVEWQETFEAMAVPEAFNKRSVVNVSSNTSLTPRLSWNESAGATFYEVCHDTSLETPCAEWVSAGNLTSMIIGRLSANTTYFWQVRAVNASGVRLANEGEAWSFKTGDVPGVFGKHSVARYAKNVSLNPTVTWGASAGAAVYEVCYDTTNDNSCEGWIQGGNQTSATLKGLKANTTYYWQVRARNGFGMTMANDGTYWKFTTRR